MAFDDDAHEAAMVADACWHEFTGGVPWHRMAILFRTNAQSSLFETALARRGVPFRVTGAQRFAARPVVRVLLDRMREAERNAPARSFTDHLADLAADADADPTMPKPTPGRPNRRRPSPHAVADVPTTTSCARIATRSSASVATTPPPKPAAVRSPGSSRGSSSRRARAVRRRVGVDLVTFHRAKGLEWQVVFVTGLERGLVPISWAATPEGRAEERRLLHVALGRAEDWLHCSWARERTAHGRRSARQPSPWLGELEQAIARVPVARSTRRRASAARLEHPRAHTPGRPNRRATPGAGPSAASPVA